MASGDSLKKTTVWFVGGIFSAPLVIAAIRQAEAEQGSSAKAQGLGSMRIMISHRLDEKRGMAQCDIFEPEPAGREEAGFIEWSLEMVRRHGVDLIIPRRYGSWFARARKRFSAVGAQVLVPADAETLDTIENKAALYRALPPQMVNVPRFHVVRDLTAFDDACADLSLLGTVCIKPTVGIAARGFRVLNKALGAGRADGDVYMSREQARAELAAMTVFPELMVMPYLAGPERSLDCLGLNGVLVCAVVRRKSQEGEQLLEDHQELLQVARKLTEVLNLSGLYNIQFMEGEDGRQYLLEINTRMAGGVHLGAASGVCLPYWAVRLATGSACLEDVPEPRTGGAARKA